jgi:hypothetical protein
MLILLLQPFINTREEIDKDIGYRVENGYTYLGHTKISTIRSGMLFLLISISLASIYGYDYENRSPGTYAQNGNNNNTIQVNCLDIALVLAVLDFSIELGDKESVDKTLKESEIAPGSKVSSPWNRLFCLSGSHQFPDLTNLSVCKQ